MKKYISYSVILILVISVFILPIVILNAVGMGLLGGTILLATVIYLLYKYDPQEVVGILTRVPVYIIWGYSSHRIILNLWDLIGWMGLASLLLVGSICLCLFRRSKKRFLTNLILVTICFGITPILVYFGGFSLLPDSFIESRYFNQDSSKIVALFKEHNSSELLPELAIMYEKNPSLREMSQFVAGDSEAFQNLLVETKTLDTLASRDITIDMLSDYFVTWDRIFTFYDHSFMFGGFGIAFLLFCLYHYFFNKRKDVIVIIGLWIAVLMFLSTLTNGGFLYWLFNNVFSSLREEDVSITDIEQMVSFLTAMSVAFGIFIAIDRVYKIDTEKPEAEEPVVDKPEVAELKVDKSEVNMVDFVKNFPKGYFLAKRKDDTVSFRGIFYQDGEVYFEEEYKLQTIPTEPKSKI